LILKHFNARRVLHSGLPGPKLYQNPLTAPWLYQNAARAR
jgi:hypothetical protein